MDTTTLHTSLTALAEKVHDLHIDLNQGFSSMPTSLTSMTTASHRLPLSTKTQDPAHLQRQALVEYMTKGDDGGLEQKSLSTQTGAEGGYLIPEAISTQIITTLQNRSPLRQLAAVTSTSTDSLEFLVDREAFAAGWAGEVDNREETATSALGRIKIHIHELYAKPRATQKLLEDGMINVESWLVEKITERLSALENQAFLQGDGQGKPRGILTYTTAPQDTVTWGQFEHITTGADGAFGDEEGDVLLRAIESLKGVYHHGAVFLMAPSTLGTLRRLKDGDGRYLWQPSLEAGAPSTLLGFPVHVCDDMPVLKPGESATGIIFGNFRHAYQIVDRKAMTLLRDPYSAKPFVEFYATKRVGGDVVNFEALKMIRFAA